MIPWILEFFGLGDSKVAKILFIAMFFALLVFCLIVVPVLLFNLGRWSARRRLQRKR